MPFIRVTNLISKPIVIKDPVTRYTATVVPGTPFDGAISQAVFDNIKRTLERLKVTKQIWFEATFYDADIIDETGPAGAPGTDGAKGDKGDKGDPGPPGAGVAVRWPCSQPLSAIVSQIPLLGAGAAIVELVDDGGQVPWSFDVAGRDWSNVKWIGMARADYLGGVIAGLALINLVYAPSGGVFNAENVAFMNGGAALSTGTNNLTLILKRCGFYNLGGGPLIDMTVSGMPAIYDFDEVTFQGNDAGTPAMLLHGGNTFPGTNGYMSLRNCSFLAPYAIGHTGGLTSVLTVNMDATCAVEATAIGANVTLNKNLVGSAAHLLFSAATPSDWNGSPPGNAQAAIDRLAALVKALNAGTGA